MITKIHFRPFEDRDYKEVYSWWVESGQIPPERMMLPETTLVAENEEEQLLGCVSLILTNTVIAWVENFIFHPNADKQTRDEIKENGFDLLEKFAFAHGKTRLFCLASNPATKRLYKMYGFTPTLDGVTTMTKEIYSMTNFEISGVVH